MRLFHSFLITLLFVQPAAAYQSAICQTFLGSRLDLNLSRTPDVRAEWDSIVDVLNASSEPNAGNWYFANMILPRDVLYAKELASTSAEVDQAIHRQIKFNQLYRAKKLYANHVFGKTTDAQSFLKDLGKFEGFSATPEIVSRVREMSNRIAASGRGDAIVDVLLESIFEMKSSGLVSQDFPLTAIYHRHLAELGFMPSLHGISAATDLAKFKSEMKDRIILAGLLKDDVRSRALLKMPIKGSPVVFLGDIPPQISIQSIQKNRSAKIDFDLISFANFLRKREYAGLANLQQAVDDFVATFQKWSVEFVNKSNGSTDRFVLNSIPKDFVDNFFETTLNNTQKWQAKIRAFYRREELLHRGQFATKYLSDREVMRMFTSIDKSTVSMRSKIGAGIINQPFVTRDFRTFNTLFEENPGLLLKYIEDHMTEGGLYLQSPFLSSSKNAVTAKRFAKGFLREPEEVAAMKSQITYSFYRTNGFGEVDVNRLNSMLKANGSEFTFTSKYGRQEEVMTVGAIAPDAVVEVRVVDVEDIVIEQNTQQNIVEAQKILKERVFSRSFEDPGLIKVEETVAGVTTVRYYRAKRNLLGLFTFSEAKGR